jgi:hypothetical protein
MFNKEFVMNLLKENNGIVESKQLREAEIDNKILQRLEQAGEIERVGEENSNAMLREFCLKKTDLVLGRQNAVVKRFCLNRIPSDTTAQFICY